ncbi:hypothetical protein BC937DRAFT_92066 [Endogone sp. FLAS-F59071]|nr:hypothetical protein BC937DRAFT_92066 [Endogone sp. FLAS-F59071]|eukprot:RUS23133.1 hypothetical protein BC937DRAFT_92066 [Endogone sp. FLAS-F59071]
MLGLLDPSSSAENSNLSQPCLFLSFPSDILYTITDNLLLVDLFNFSHVSHTCRLLSHKAIFARHELDLIEFYSEPKPDAAINLQGFLISTHDKTSKSISSHAFEITLLEHIHVVMLSPQIRYDEHALRDNLKCIVAILIKDGMLTRSSTPHHYFLLKVLKHLTNYISPSASIMSDVHVKPSVALFTSEQSVQNEQALAIVRNEIPGIVTQSFSDLLKDPLITGQFTSPSPTTMTSSGPPVGIPRISANQRKRAYAHLQSLTDFLITLYKNTFRYSQDGLFPLLSEDSVLGYLENVSRLLDDKEDALYKASLYKNVLADLQKMRSTRLMEAIKEKFPKISNVTETSPPTE